MIRIRSFIKKILSRTYIHNNSIQKNKNYSRLILATGILGLSAFFWWQHFRSPFPYPLPTLLKNSFFTPQLNQRKKDYNFIVNVTKKCAPSVVAIEVKNSARISPETGKPMLTSTGSGFLVKNNGWIITNAHVIMNKPNAIVNVITTTGETYEATVQDIDLKLDLALLKIPCYTLPALSLGNSQDVLTGEWVVALGSPLSLRHTITAGVVSSISREAKDLGISNSSFKYIQTDAAITFGHSGGPLVNLDGEVIGVNNLRITAGIAFAIPIDSVKEFLLRSKLYSAENAKIQESMKHPKFGITALVVTDKLVKQLLQDQNVKLPEKIEGVLVWNVVKNSPAYKAGFIAGDVITHVNKNMVFDVNDLYSFLSLHEKEPITFTIYRRGIQTTINLKVKDKL